MKIARCIDMRDINHRGYTITWWMNRCDKFTFSEYNKSNCIMFADVDDSIYEEWKNGTFVQGNRYTVITPSTGIKGIYISITEDDFNKHLTNLEFVQIKDYEQFATECIKRNIPLSDRDIEMNTPDTEFSGWMCL